MKILNFLKKTKKEDLKPMGVIKVGKNLPFNEMAQKQNISLYNVVK